MAELGIGEFRVLLNSRRVLAGLLEAFGVPDELGAGVLITLDKLDKLAARRGHRRSSAQRGLAADRAAELVGRDDRAGRGRPDQGRAQAERRGQRPGLDEVDRVLSLVAPQLPPGRIAFTPRLVRGLSYYTGPIWEVVAPGRGRARSAGAAATTT